MGRVTFPIRAADCKNARFVPDRAVMGGSCPGACRERTIHVRGLRHGRFRLWHAVAARYPALNRRRRVIRSES